MAIRNRCPVLLGARKVAGVPRSGPQFVQGPCDGRWWPAAPRQKHSAVDRGATSINCSAGTTSASAVTVGLLGQEGTGRQSGGVAHPAFSWWATSTWRGSREGKRSA